MPSWLRLDWKFWLTIVVGIGALFPAWLPYLQAPTAAIDLRLVSQSALQPVASKDKTLGLEVTIDKVPVVDPYLSVIQIVNVGNKPISSADFERPLEIFIDDNKVILRTVISDFIPKDLKPTITSDKQTIRLQPTLLNPNDSITLSILSSGGSPTFTPSTRIAGISAITLSNLEEVNQTSTTNLTIITFMGLITIIASTAVAWRIDPTNKVMTLNRGTAYLVHISTAFAAVFFIKLIMPMIGFETGTNLFTGVLLATVASAPLAIWFEKRRAINESKNQPIDG